MAGELKSALIAEMKRVGAHDVKVADPRRGFEHASKERHPLTAMPDCKSVIAFIVPRADIPDCMFIGVRRSVPQSPDTWTRYLDIKDTSNYIGYRVAFLFTAYVILKAMSFLSESGYKAVERCDKLPDGRTQIAEKLCAYEAGLGVYGKSGLILHPELGNRIVIGVLLTDAVLEPDEKLDDFNPCANCEACIKACPAGAYGEDGFYHGVWSREKCESKRKALEEMGYSICNLCWDVCPVGKSNHHDLFVMGVRQRKPLTKLADWVDRAVVQASLDVSPGLIQ